MTWHAAVDLGASSGRVILGQVEPTGVTWQEVHRFANAPVPLTTGLHWDVVGLFAEVLNGLRAAGRALPEGQRLASIGIDSWAVDYALIDQSGAMLGTPFCYRDSRTAQGVRAVHAIVTPQELYTHNGLQFLAFNTIYQLAAESGVLAGALSAGAARVALIPDLLGYWLTGTLVTERTNASTTGLLEVSSGEWNHPLAARIGIPAQALTPLVDPGTTLGPLRPGIAEATGLPATTPVVAVATHDTASSVAAVPASGNDFAYISCGTWSLVGIELQRPVLTEASREAGFTHEGGVDGTIRYLHNVMGLWLLSESLRHWQNQGRTVDLRQMLGAAGELPAGGPRFDPDDDSLLPPGDLPTRIRALLAAGGEPVPAQGAPGDAPLVRAILDSLAAAYARVLRDAEQLSGRSIERVHLVGGGVNNTLLCQLTADATGRRVLAGPVESTALGNLLIQARALGTVTGSLDDLRGLVRAGESVVEYLPR